MHRADICIAGAGIIGLSLALELQSRGADVLVLERDMPLSHASQAAAGMLAAYDPENPRELLPLAELSLALYPAFLGRVESLSGLPVPFQTSLTYQSTDRDTPAAHLPAALIPGRHTFTRLHEHSLDPRQLAPALLAAVRATSIRILDRTTLRTATSTPAGVTLETTSGPILTRRLVQTLGPWRLEDAIFPPVGPRKGQMLAVRIPSSLHLDYVVRTPEIYIVPRTHGPRAGQAILGATVEDAGFSLHTDPHSLSRLRTLAAELVPALADEASAPAVDRWAGLRPDTPDHLPVLGLTDLPHQCIAGGHYRNGILLAPATAHVLAQLLAGESPAIDLTPFSPSRFLPRQQPKSPQPIFAHTT